MKKFILFFFILVNINAFAQGITPDALRREYQLVNSDSATCAKLYKKIIKSNNADVTTTAYRGAISASMANYSKDKKEKLKLFNEGRKWIDQSISADTNNIETRFLRFTIQTNCPKALNYNKQIKSDKEFILKNYSTITSMAVKKMITSFLLQSKALTVTEKQKLK